MEKNKPVVSIIVANFNGQKYLASNLKSLLQLDYDAYKVIVVDDYSSDNSQAVLSFYEKYKKIKCIYNKSNLGAAVARNEGARISKGGYLLFLDMDCKLDRKSIGAIVKEFKSG